MRRRPDRLGAANLAFVAANLAHVLDHLRQGAARLTAEVVWGGSVLTVVALATLTFTLRRDPRAGVVAAVVGLGSAAAIAAAHLAPHWSAFSDPYPDLGADALSWAVMLAELLSALALGLLGLRAARRSRPATPRTALVR